MLALLLILLALFTTTANLTAQNSPVAAKNTISAVTFKFYEQPVTISYHSNIRVPFKGEHIAANFEHFFKQLQVKDTQTLSHSLIWYKKQFNLNDWLFFQLIYQTVYNIFPKETDTYRTLFMWFVMEAQGYETQLNYDKNDIYLNVFSEKKVFDNAVIEVPGRGWMVNLSSYLPNIQVSQVVNKPLSSYKRVKNNKPFDFTLTNLPEFDNCQSVHKAYSFVHDNITYNIDINYNNQALFVRFKYPAIHLPEVAKTPLSEEAVTSLKEAFKPLVRNKTNYEALRLILSFVRSLVYGEDIDKYHQNNIIFSAEETLAYQYSDCEDRAILFKHLAKLILNLDVVLLEKDDHVACGVAMVNLAGDKIWHNGKAYTYCEPTGPDNHLKPGELPKGYLIQDFKVVE
ncbi:MAG TPA: hypothetical protein PK239_17190 [Chitinophagales bacterium]|nr:hypothetical protein [Chitinophagales bacterium]